jgi:processive 1,2-diacylglycerol beta-glucosyltransferase
VLDMFTDVMNLYLLPGKYSCNDIYNYALIKGHIRILNVMKTIVHYFFIVIKPFNAWLIKKTIVPHKPDCLISIVPLSNAATLAVAQELNIPFFLIPVDLDPRTFLCGIKNPSYDKFYIADVVQHPKIHAYIADAGIKKDRIIHTGFVVRPDFLEPKDPVALKKKFNIPENVPVIMIMLGSTGSDHAYTLAQQLFNNIHTQCHIIFCVGRQKEMEEKIKSLKHPSHISVQVIGFTREISNLLATADIYVTKPGSNSFAEALQMNIPMIIARFGKTLKWEQFNVHYLTSHKMGMVADGEEAIQKSITYLLDNPDELKSMKDIMKARKKFDLDNNINNALADIMR